MALSKQEKIMAVIATENMGVGYSWSWLNLAYLF